MPFPKYIFGGPSLQDRKEMDKSASYEIRDKIFTSSLIWQEKISYGCESQI